METDTSEAEIRSKQKTMATNGHGGEEVVMKSGEADEEGACVNLSVSHDGLAEGLRPLASMKMNLWVQAQDKNRDPKENNGRNLKDITNKLEARPTIAKASRPTSTSLGAQQAGVD